MKKVLITGGAGFIGSHLSIALTKLKYDVVVLDNLSSQVHGADPELTSPLFKYVLENGISVVKGDICDRDLLLKVISGVEVIVHLAAETGTGQSMYEIEKYSKVNIQGTAAILDILANHPNDVKKIVVASSRSIYGEGKYFSANNGVVYPEHRKIDDLTNGKFEVSYNGSWDLELRPTDEQSKIHPSSVYGITKQVQEQLIMTVSPTIGVKPVALRYQNVYGPGQSLSNPYTGILSIFSSRILSGKSINIFEDGKESRDFVYIDDVVQATILAIQNDDISSQSFNVGTGVQTTVLEVAEQLMLAYDKTVDLQITGNFRLGDIRHNFADLNKIKITLGFEPRFNFNDGIKLFADWVISQKVADDQYENSLAEMRSKGLLK